MNPTPIYITQPDHAKLRLLLATALSHNPNAAHQKLREELDRAVVIDPSAMPADVVTMESNVEFEDVETHEVENYIISFPERANVEEKRLSILAPIGTALIGYRVGEVVSWSTPGGVRQLKIRRVNPPVLDSAPSTPSGSVPSFIAH